MFRYFIRLAYKGTAYHGWQIQENTLKTIQQELNTKLGLVLSESLAVTGCGRTDTGVHAKDFVAHFDSARKIEKSDVSTLVHKFNSVLPGDIVVYDLWEVPADANARFDAISRSYDYVISLKKDPFLIDAAWITHRRPSLSLMNKGAQLLLEYTDFTSFSKTHTQTHTNNCKIRDAVWRQEKELLIFTITADRFLRNMVRAIVGTLLELGEGKIDLDEFKSIIESKDRSKAGFSVPAAGLYLTKINYPDHLQNRSENE